LFLVRELVEGFDCFKEPRVIVAERFHVASADSGGKYALGEIEHAVLAMPGVLTTEPLRIFEHSLAARR
jgi:hypothetical protein